MNLEGGLFSGNAKVPALRQGWIGYPWMWDKEKPLILKNIHNQTRPGGNHFFGPNTDEFGEQEFQRLIKLYDAFKKQDYIPEAFADGYIGGYILIKGDDYRFVVTEGQHRIACLAALGYERIRCKFDQRPGYPRTVNYFNIKKWGQVENKVYSRNLAGKVLNRFFEEGVGRDRMAFKKV